MQAYHSIREAIEVVFGGAEIKGRRAISGGDINTAYCYRFCDGRNVFIKTNSKKDTAFFEAEAKGLRAISATQVISVPSVLAVGDDPDEGGFLIMEFVSGREKREDFWDDLGTQLAMMHKADTSLFVANGRYGFSEDNFIGSRAQDNTPSDRWVEFFRDYRLMPRFEEAMVYFEGDLRHSISYLLDHLDRWITEPPYPSLLHGDLWNGNFITGSDGRAWLIDPAVYVGDADADIAMTELFGGFSGEFYRAYRRVMPERSGYEERRDIYNLYHLLNHLISCGGGYLGAVEKIVRRYAT